MKYLNRLQYYYGRSLLPYYIALPYTINNLTTALGRILFSSVVKGMVIRAFTLSQTSPVFFRVCTACLLKTLWEKEKLLVTSNFSFSHRVFKQLRAISPFPTVFSTCLEKVLPFSSNLKLSSATSFSLEESKIYRLGKS